MPATKRIAELKVLGELTKKAWEHDVQVMIEGPRAHPHGQNKEQVDKEMEWCHEAPFYAWPAGNRHCSWHDHITSADRRAMIGWFRRIDALLRHAEGTPRLAESRRRQAGRNSLQNCLPLAAVVRSPPPRALRTCVMLCRTPAFFDCEHIRAFARSPPAKAMHDEYLPDYFY